MVLLTVTPATKTALQKYSELRQTSGFSANSKLDELSGLGLGDPIDHADLIELSRLLVEAAKDIDDNAIAREWRLESLVKGAVIYQPPPVPRPEPTSEYKALMARLRREEEAKRYERMINPPSPLETFAQRFPGAKPSFGSSQLGPFGADGEVDEVTYADVNRQMTLIINVLVSIICCAIAIWIAARRWDVPQRLGLSMSGSGLVAIAEVTIYMGYIKRVKEAKGKEVKKVERKEVMETWVLDASKGSGQKEESEGMRHRKGKHR